MSRPRNPGAADMEELRERLARAGAEALTTTECLTLAIRAGARRAAPGWAERLLSGFGSLPDLLGAPAEALARAAPPAVAAEIEVLNALRLRGLREPLAPRMLLGDLGPLPAYLRAAMGAERRQQVRALFVGSRWQLLAEEVLWRGSPQQAPFYVREVVRRALEHGASGVVLARNDPFGSFVPTRTDVERARSVAAAGKLLEVSLLDSFVVAGSAVTSLRDRGLL